MTHKLNKKKSYKSKYSANKKIVSNDLMIEMLERLKNSLLEYEKEYKKNNPSKKRLTKRAIAQKTGFSPTHITQLFKKRIKGVQKKADERDITVDVLVAFENAFGISSNYILHGTPSKGAVPQIATSISIPKDLIDQIITNKSLQEQQGPLALPILNLSKGTGTGDLKSGLLIIQDRIYGRRKNFIPIRIDGNDQINIILLEKNLEGQTQKQEGE